MRRTGRGGGFVSIMVAAIVISIVWGMVPPPTASAAEVTSPSAEPGAWNPSPAVPAGRSYLYMESEPGDPLGRGRTELATSGDSYFRTYGSRVQVVAEHSSWVVQTGFALSSPPPMGEVQQYQPGTYARVLVTVDSTTGCPNSGTGWAVVDHFHAAGDDGIAELDARVELSCGGNPPLRLELHFRAADTTLPPPPPPVPTGLWDAPVEVMEGDDAFYLEAAPGEYLTTQYGLARSHFLSGDVVRVNNQGAHGIVVFTGLGGWSVSFKAPTHVGLATEGLYRWTRAGGEVSGAFSASFGNRVCLEEGWVVVDHIGWDGERLVSLVMRFEERCSPGAAPLRGKVVYNAPADTPGESAPIGNLEVIDRPAGSSTVTVRGWALDPDSPRSIPVHVYAGGSGVATVADAIRPDVGAAFRYSGAAHGYTATVTVPPGARQVCAYGIDVGGRVPNPAVGCAAVAGRAFGSLDEVAQSGPGIALRGWAIDPDTTSPTGFGVIVDGRLVEGVASDPRPDVAAAFGRGDLHGFRPWIALAPGVHQVCVVAADWYGPEPNTSLGCRSVTVVPVEPFGSLDLVARSDGAVRVAGWAIDPDLPGPAEVHVYVDGAVVSVRATVGHPDVGAAYPAYGSTRGYDVALGLPDDGPHRVCAYAIDAAGKVANRLLGCRDV